MNDIQRAGILRKVWLWIVFPYRQTKWFFSRVMFRWDVYSAIKEASVMEKKFQEKRQSKHNWNYLRNDLDKTIYINGFDAGIDYVLKRQWRDDEKTS